MKNFLILLCLFIVACSNDNNIVQRLAQEPAIVREVKGANNLFVLDLQNANSGLYSSYIVPSATLPTDYKKNGLPVFISGDVTSNSIAVDGYISEGNGNTITLNGKYNMVELITMSMNLKKDPYCEDREIIKVLKDEPAYIRKHCFEHVGRVDTFFFELVNSHSEFFSLVGVFPIGEIPLEYRKEGLSVYINGNVTNCVVTGGCIEPNIKLTYIHLFELKSIDTKEK